MTPRPRVGYVGLNHHHAESYLASLNELPVSVTAACEPTPGFDAGTVRNLGDVPVFDDLETLLDESDVDIVWLTLPNRDTPSAIAAAADRGVDVYTEKPGARTTDELRELIERVGEEDATICVSYLWRGFPPARDVRERAESGFFGDVRAIDVRFIASQLAFRDTDHFLFDRAASRGGIVQWLGVHFLDLVPWMLDDPITRVCSSLRFGVAEVGVEDGGTVQFETESGALGTLQTGYYLPEGRYDTRIGIYGTGGRCDWDPIGGEFGFDGETVLEIETTEDWDGAPRRQITYDYEPSPGYGGGPGLSFMRKFLEARRREDELPPATLEDAVDALRVLDAIYESASENSWVAVEYA